MKNAKKWLIGTGVVVAGAAAVGAGIRAVSKYFVKLAMDRKHSGKIQAGVAKVSGGSVTEKLLAQPAQATQALENATQNTVQIESHDGLRLVGHWYPAEQPKSGRNEPIKSIFISRRGNGMMK